MHASAALADLPLRGDLLRLRGILGGLLAAIMVKLSLIALGVIAVAAAGVLLLVRGHVRGIG